MNTRSLKPTRGRAVFVAILAAIIGMGWWVRDVSEPPRTRAELEQKMDRPFLAYQVWDGTPMAVFQWSPDGDLVYFDQLRLDWISINWPPVPAWQWTGNWRYIDSTDDPASVAWAVGWWGEALYGQVNDPSIVSFQVNTDGVTASYPVAAPGFLIRLPEDAEKPNDYQFLDVDGHVVWTTTGSEFGP